MKYVNLDVGNVELRMDHIGNLRPNGIGGRWTDPQQSQNPILYDHGLNIIGKINDTLKTIMDYWWSPYSPGPIFGNVPAIYSNRADTSRYRPYKITRGDTFDSNPDLRDWPLDLGAPADSLNRPRLFGDQSVWMVYNGLDKYCRGFYPANDTTRVTMPLEIHQTTYAYKKLSNDLIFNFIADVVFFEWKVINKSAYTIDSLFIGFWTDIDFNQSNDNPPAVDTLLQSGYCWTSRDTLFDQNGVPYFINKPLTVGYTLLHGPQEGHLGGTAVFGERMVEDKRNLSMTSFWGIRDDSYSDSSDYGPPYSIGTAWNVAKGLRPRGIPMVDSTTGRVTRFAYSGDPLTGQGWIYKGGTGGGAGFLFYSGPVTMAPLDTQWMMIALVPTLGTNRFESVRLLRLKTALLRELSVKEIRGNGFNWDTNEVKAEIPLYHDVYQNYPNPFNASTKIPYDVAIDSDVKIEIYNTLGQKVRELVNKRIAAGKHEAVFDSDGLPTGVYYCLVKIDYFLLSKKMMLVK